jgi:hypothetical protein
VHSPVAGCAAQRGNLRMLVVSQHKELICTEEEPLVSLNDEARRCGELAHAPQVDEIFMLLGRFRAEETDLCA